MNFFGTKNIVDGDPLQEDSTGQLLEVGKAPDGRVVGYKVRFADNRICWIHSSGASHLDGNTIKAEGCP